MPACHSDAEQERNEKAREWRLPGDCADGGERLARLPRRCNRLTEAIDCSLKRCRHIRDRAGYIGRGIDRAFRHVGLQWCFGAHCFLPAGSQLHLPNADGSMLQCVTA
jgi:hypothetical protein